MKKFTARIICMIITTSLLLSSCGIVIINDRYGESETLPPSETTQKVTETAETNTAGETETTRETTIYTPYTPPDYKSQAEKMLAELPDYDFGGIAVTIAATSSESYVPAAGDTEVNAARIIRNTLFEKKYNTHLICTVYDKATLLEESKLSLLSDSYLADLISIPMSELGSYVSADILMNLRSLPFTDYNAPYYNADAIEAASAGNGTWAALGEANRNDYHLYCVYFNRSMINNLKLEDPYTLVSDGSWTWDAMLSLSKASAEINGGAGQGSSLSATGYIELLAASTGEQLSSSGIGVIPTSVTASARISSAVEKLKKLLSSEGAYLAEPSAALGSFYDGNMLFFTERLTVAQWINDMKDDWGLLPLPKLSTEQENYSGMADKAQPVFAVLSHNANAESTAHFLQGYNAASYGYIAEEFKNTLMMRTLRDNNSVNMLDYVTTNINYDFSVMFGGAYPSVADATYGALADAVSGTNSLDVLVRARSPYMDAKMKAVFKIYA